MAVSDKPRVVGDWLVIGGYKVAKVEGDVLAFKDRCKRRSSDRGTKIVRVTVEEIKAAIDLTNSA
jgi:hypothetical protein